MQNQPLHLVPAPCVFRHPVRLIFELPFDPACADCNWRNGTADLPCMAAVGCRYPLERAHAHLRFTDVVHTRLDTVRLGVGWFLDSRRVLNWMLETEFIQNDRRKLLVLSSRECSTVQTRPGSADPSNP